MLPEVCSKMGSHPRSSYFSANAGPSRTYLDPHSVHTIRDATAAIWLLHTFARHRSGKVSGSRMVTRLHCRQSALSR